MWGLVKIKLRIECALRVSCASGVARGADGNSLFRLSCGLAIKSITEVCVVLVYSEVCDLCGFDKDLYSQQNVPWACVGHLELLGALGPI